jgi:hypothetical protein
MTGSNAESNMNFDFQNTWTTQSNDYPIQQQFVEPEPITVNLTDPQDNEEFPFFTDTVSLTANLSLGDFPDSEVNWTVNGQVVNTQTYSSSGEKTYSHPVSEGESYDWSVQTEGESTETRTFSVENQTSGFYETSLNFNFDQTLLETHTEGEVNLSVNDQNYELSDGTNTIDIEERNNYSIRYNLTQTESVPEPRVSNLTFYSTVEEGVIEQTTFDMEDGEITEGLSQRFGEDPAYIDLLIEMDDSGGQAPRFENYNLTYTSDEEVRSIGFGEGDVGLILIAVLVVSFALVILKS